MPDRLIPYVTGLFLVFEDSKLYYIQSKIKVMKTVLFVVSTVGFHWEEVFDPYLVYKNAGWEVIFSTVNGKSPVPDPKSLEKHEFLSAYGLGLNDSFAPTTAAGQELLLALQKNRALSLVDPSMIDVLYIPGGHGCLFDVNIDPEFHKMILYLYENGKILSAVCHGTSTFSFVKKDGKSIAKGKRMTGFPDKLDSILISLGWVDKSFLPLPFKNQEAMENAEMKVHSGLFLSTVSPAYIEIDHPFYSGIGPKAAENVARKILASGSKLQ